MRRVRCNLRRARDEACQVWGAANRSAKRILNVALKKILGQTETNGASIGVGVGFLGLFCPPGIYRRSAGPTASASIRDPRRFASAAPTSSHLGADRARSAGQRARTGI